MSTPDHIVRQLSAARGPALVSGCVSVLTRLKRGAMSLGRQGFSRRRLAELAGVTGVGAVTSGWAPANAETEQPFQAWRGGGELKYVRLTDGVDRLYNLKDDVREQADLARKRPADLAALQAVWESVDATLVPYPS